MTSDKIVKALRLCADKTEHCEECHTGQSDCPFGETVIDCCERMNRSSADLIESLQSQLAESQRRERAAVEDLNGTGACFTCKHFRRNGGDCFGAGRCRLDGIEIWPCNEPGVYRVEVPDDGRKTYEWRGEKGAEK